MPLVILLLSVGLALLGVSVWFAIRTYRKRAWWELSLALVLFLAACLFLGGIVATRIPTIQTVSLAMGESVGGERLRVAFCSDLHLGLYKGNEWMESLVQILLEESPDLILWGGDFVYRASPEQLAEDLRPLSLLHPRFGSFAVLGNHDYGFPGLDYSATLERDLINQGVEVLQNEVVDLEGGVRVIGMDDLWAGRTDFRPIERAFENQTGLILLLAHNPDILAAPFPQGPPGWLPEATRSRILWLFGHTHAGQVRLPFIGPLALPTTLRYDRGLFQSEWGPLYVTQGAGEVGLPVRLLTVPEIVIFELSYKSVPR
ncbi:MAG: metallophosphoesterase [Coprothermobacterota bacterium]|jgi:predicted MPP superfamily phosphohydrolase|nr:metallophosphoesterase [Coprothermobacterota bacterium]